MTLKLIEYAKYYLIKTDFNLTADIFFNKQNNHSPSKKEHMSNEIDLSLKKLSGLAVKLGMISEDKQEDFRKNLYEEARKYYS